MKYYHKTYARDPYWTDARFRSICKCGQVINKGDRIFYCPATKTALCPKCSEKAANEFVCAVQDEDFYNSQY